MEQAPNIDQYHDTTQMLAQLGRFDLVALLLAAIGLVLVVGGVFAFLNIRAIAKNTAREEASKVAQSIAEEVANIYIQDELPALWEEYKKFFGDSLDEDDHDGFADEIAEAQEE